MFTAGLIGRKRCVPCALGAGVLWAPGTIGIYVDRRSAVRSSVLHRIPAARFVSLTRVLILRAVGSDRKRATGECSGVTENEGCPVRSSPK